MTFDTMASCPALLISAPASGQGKTTITAALARYHTQQGRKVRVFKTGPDFIDPMFLERASGYPVYQLDLWLVGEEACRQLLFEAAVEANLILIEGVMGLFDGVPASADLAGVFGIPVLAVIDAGAMAQTFGALVQGLASYRKGLPFAGVLANRVASAGHCEMLKNSLPEGFCFFGALFNQPELAFPNRHLGLVQAVEIEDLEGRLNGLALSISATELIHLPQPVNFNAAPRPSPPRLLERVRLGIARDQAFSFIYPANLDLLRAMGAELCFFSPLRDRALPEVDSLYLPGGYPELYLQTLEDNVTLKQAIRRHAEAGKPILAECGGMLFLLDELWDHSGRRGAMCGLLPGAAYMQKRLVGLGTQSAELGGADQLRAHTFHHSRLETNMTPHTYAKRQYGGGAGEAIYRKARVTASYLHWYLPCCPEAAAQLLRP